ncbi:MAG: hypothetical protein M8353_00805, partial [ANME-2 cluster archaeon]|nr:hypothetical protein [ANME-2 cluster archaeon]
MLRDLHTRGMNITQISKKTGHDRKTVRKHLDSTSMPEPPKRPEKESKLDNYKDYIIAKLHEGPYTASRLRYADDFIVTPKTEEIAEE